MQLNLIGLSHLTAPLDIRDQVALTPTVQEKAQSILKSSGSKLLEGVVLSTCNRSEVYATTEGDDTDAMPVAHLVSRQEGRADKAVAREVLGGCQRQVLGEMREDGVVRLEGQRTQHFKNPGAAGLGEHQAQSGVSLEGP